MIRTYREMSRLPTLRERYEYLRLRGAVGDSTFGFDRWMNQEFYRSKEWKQLRHEVIARDEGCDLGVPGFEIHDKVIVHHMNPIEAAHISQGDPDILNPEYLVCVSHKTHNAIHYGDETLLPRVWVPRQPGDTRLW